MSTTDSEPVKKTFHGSCHCKFITYTIDLAQSQLEKRRAGRCNCTICLKQGYTNLRLARSDFKLLTPASFAECKDYRVNPEHNVHKYFCGNCGIHVAGEGSFEWKGQVVEFFTVNMLTIDQPQDGLDLSQWKCTYVDGRNNMWENVSDDVPWPGGML